MRYNQLHQPACKELWSSCRMGQRLESLLGNSRLPTGLHDAGDSARHFDLLGRYG